MGEGTVRTGNYESMNREDRELLGRELPGQGTIGQVTVRRGNCDDRELWVGEL